MADLSLSNPKNDLEKDLTKAQKELELALTESFDTPRAMRVLNDLVKTANIHITDTTVRTNIQGLKLIARWVTKIVGIFGLDANASAPYDGLGWTNTLASSQLSPKEAAEPFAAAFQKIKAEVEGLGLQSETLEFLLKADVDAEFQSLVSAGNKDPEALVMPYLRAASKTRDEIRKLAPASTSKKEVLGLSDRIRDDDMTNLGVYLDDRPGKGALIKFIPREELLAQREEKAAKEQAKLVQKEAAKLALQKQELERAEKAKQSPLNMFRNDKFSAWDAEGLPTLDKEGKEVPKSALKKMKKEWDRQKKANDEWKAKNGA